MTHGSATPSRLPERSLTYWTNMVRSAWLRRKKLVRLICMRWICWCLAARQSTRDSLQLCKPCSNAFLVGYCMGGQLQPLIPATGWPNTSPAPLLKFTHEYSSGPAPMCDPDPHVSFPWYYGDSWVSSIQLRALLKLQCLRGTGPYRHWPYIRVAKLGYMHYHVFPHDSNLGRLYHWRSLPRGWYGFGPGDAAFYQDSPLHSVVLSMHLGDYNRAVSNSRLVAPYAVPRKMEGFLQGAGINLPPPHAQAHPHPVHYALHNRSLMSLVPALGGKWFGLFLSQARINFLQQCGAVAPSGVYNSRNEGKDILRYYNTPLPPRPTRGAHPSALVDFPHSDAEVWFADDVLHYLNPKIVGSWFDSNPKLKYCFFTTVIPPETCFGLPSLFADLYDYIRVGDDLKYIPEGDNGGAYTQPYSAARWLRTNKIISPQNRCLHVSMLDTCFAHHTFVVSRPQLMPQKNRLLDMARVYVVPWYAYPTWNLYDRLTSPRLLCQLIGYAVRVSDTDIRDLYAKVATVSQAVYETYPPSFVRAASKMSKWLRNMDYHYKESWTGYVLTHLSTALRLPLFPFAYYWQAYVSTFFAQQYDRPHHWIVECSTWVSETKYSQLPGVASPLCLLGVDLFQVEPDAPLLSRFTREAAKWSVWFLMKVVAVHCFTLLRVLLSHMPGLVRFVTFVLQIDWAHVPLGILMVSAFQWYGFRGPDVSIPPFLPHLYRKAQYYYALVWALPYARLPFRTGISWVYVCNLLCLVSLLASYRVHPLMLYTDYWLTYPTFSALGKGDMPSGPLVPVPPHTKPPFFNITPSPLPGPPPPQPITPDPPSTNLSRESWLSLNPWFYWVVLASHLVVQVCVAFPIGLMFLRKAAYSPVHGDEEHACFSFDNYQEALRDAGGTPEEPHAVDVPPDPPGLPDTPVANAPSTDEAFEDPPPLPPIEGPGPEVVPAPPVGLNLPPVVAGDPLRNWNLPPRAVQDFDTWLNLMARLPAPPNALGAAICVWEVLSARLTLPPSVLWACYCSSLPPARRAVLANGTVPPDQLDQILTFFAIGYEIRGATSDVNGHPRGPGGVPPPPMFDPAAPPTHRGEGLPGWPHLVAFEQLNPDGSYHFTTEALAVGTAPPYTPPRPGQVIGWPSRFVPAIEIGEVVNVPGRAFGIVYRRLAGFMPNFLSPFAGMQRIRNFVLPVVPVQEEVVQYTLTAVDAQNALELAQDIKSDPASLKLHDYNSHTTSRGIHSMAQQLLRFTTTGAGLAYRPVNIHLYHGIYGSGKTWRVIQDIAARHARTPFTPATLAFHTWDHDLRGPLQQAALQALPNIGLQSNNFMTGCMPLAQPRAGTVVFDDAGKCWNSFLPLFLAVNPGVTDIYVTFDVMQGQGVFPTAPSQSRKHPSTASWLGSMSSYYATEVVRTAADVTDLFGLPRVVVPGRVNNRGQVIVVSKAPADVPLLAVSPRFTQTQNMGGKVADTFYECQGHTIHGDVCVDLGGLTATATEAAAWTALTRATGNIYLKMGPMMLTEARVESCWAESQILSAILTVASVAQTPYITQAVDVDGLVASAVLSHMSRRLSRAAATRLGLPAPNPVIGALASYFVEERSKVR
nr:MAG: polyprotein [Hainan deltaflexi-like virus]